ncbi:MAG: hypothetical protein ABSF65_04920 [Candidatus Bathyarchaeia archaeon]
MKNPRALTKNIAIVKVSVLIFKKWETGNGSQLGWVTCITAPSSQARKPKKNSISPTTLITSRDLLEEPFMFKVEPEEDYKTCENSTLSALLLVYLNTVLGRPVRLQAKIYREIQRCFKPAMPVYCIDANAKSRPLRSCLMTTCT